MRILQENYSGKLVGVLFLNIRFEVSGGVVSECSIII